MLFVCKNIRIQKWKEQKSLVMGRKINGNLARNAHFLFIVPTLTQTTWYFAKNLCLSGFIYFFFLPMKFLLIWCMLWILLSLSLFRNKLKIRIVYNISSKYFCVLICYKRLIKPLKANYHGDYWRCMVHSKYNINGFFEYPLVQNNKIMYSNRHKNTYYILIQNFIRHANDPWAVESSKTPCRHNFGIVNYVKQLTIFVGVFWTLKVAIITKTKRQKKCNAVNTSTLSYLRMSNVIIMFSAEILDK